MNGLSPLRIFYFHLTLSLPVFQLYLLPPYILQYYDPFKAQIQYPVWDVDRASQLFLPFLLCGTFVASPRGSLDSNSVPPHPSSLRGAEVQHSPVFGVTSHLMRLAECSSSSTDSYVCLIHRIGTRRACSMGSITGQPVIRKNLP